MQVRPRFSSSKALLFLSRKPNRPQVLKFKHLRGLLLHISFYEYTYTIDSEDLVKAILGFSIDLHLDSLSWCKWPKRLPQWRIAKRSILKFLALLLVCLFFCWMMRRLCIGKLLQCCSIWQFTFSNQVISVAVVISEHLKRGLWPHFAWHEKSVLLVDRLSVYMHACYMAR